MFNQLIWASLCEDSREEVSYPFYRQIFSMQCFPFCLLFTSVFVCGRPFLLSESYMAEFGVWWSVGGKSGKLGQICSSPAEIPPLMLPRCGCGVRGCRWAEGGEGCHLELFVGTIRISHRPAQPPRSMATCLQCCQGGQIAKLLCSLIEGKPFAWA